MNEKDVSLKYSSLCDTSVVADFLDGLARQLRKGSANLVSGGKSIHLRFDPLEIVFEIEAKTNVRSGKGSLQIELSWMAPTPVSPAVSPEVEVTPRFSSQNQPAKPDNVRIIDDLKGANLDSWTVAWGWESTIDYRFEVSPEEWSSLNVPAGESDSEVRIAPREFDKVRDQVESQLGRKALVNPGGSPLLSALAIEDQTRRNAALPLPSSQFWGIYPDALDDLLGARGMDEVLRYGERRDSIKGSLSIENHTLSTKRMYSVFYGRGLGNEVLDLLKKRLSELIDGANGGIVFGLGGLNKADPARLISLVEHFKNAVSGPNIVYIATNSFAPTLLSSNRNELMARYFDLLRMADVVSMSAEEVIQLGDWLRIPKQRQQLHPVMQALELPNLAVCHHRLGAAFWSEGASSSWNSSLNLKNVMDLVTRSMARYYATGDTVFDALNNPVENTEPLDDGEYEAVFGISPDSNYASPAPYRTTQRKVALTGLGSRFDGYLSMLIPFAWRTSE
jgi:amphi-Trp domain-containing protein